MADLRTAAQQVLEAWDTRAGIDAASRAFDALRAALAQAEPVQEPVGYLPAYELNRLHLGHDGRLRSAKFGPSALDGDVALYTAPPQQAEPVERKPATGAESCVPSPSFEMTTQAEPPCDHCRSPLFCATSCRVCGRKAEPK